MKTYLSWLLPTTDSSDACTEFLVPDQEESQDSGGTTQFICTVEPYSLPEQGGPAQLGPRHSPIKGHMEPPVPWCGGMLGWIRTPRDRWPGAFMTGNFSPSCTKIQASQQGP